MYVGITIRCVNRFAMPTTTLDPKEYSEMSRCQAKPPL